MLSITALGWSALPVFAQSAVWTAHYDNNRTGANLNETILTPANVTPSTFGKLGSLPVSGCVFSQPLYAPGVAAVDGVQRNLLFIATTANHVYAYDADDYSLIYRVSFGIPAPSSDFNPLVGFHDFPDCDAGEGDGPVGIVGTPVIDMTEGAMYLVANTIDGPDIPHQHRHFLHKISLATGEDLVPPVEIVGSFAGVQFESRYQLQRSALLLADNRVYIAFGSHQDESPYSGWLFSYDTGLNQIAVKSYSPWKSGAGIWMSGGGPASDGRHIYLSTGNLAQDETEPSDLSDSVLKIDPSTLEAVQRTSFPDEATFWDQNFDLDLGSGRVILLPGTGHAISGSKYGDLFLINREGMALDARVQGVARHSESFDWTGIYNGLAYWNNMLYVWPGGGGFIYGTEPGFPVDTLKGFYVDPSASTVSIQADGQSDGVGVGYQGANVVISANGNDPSTGIVWAQTPAGNTKFLQPGYLRAYHASEVANGWFQELWNNMGDEESTFFAKFNQPLVANGKVYVPTFSSKVVIYGLVRGTVPPAAGEQRRPSQPTR